jgi:hypothetical protein
VKTIEASLVVPIHRLSGRVLGLVDFGNIPRALTPEGKGIRVNRVLAMARHESD